LVAEKIIESGVEFSLFQLISGMIVLGKECETIRHRKAMHPYFCTEFFKGPYEVLVGPTIQYGIELANDANSRTLFGPVNRDVLKGLGCSPEGRKQIAILP
jgi:hypothetical protein